MRLLGERGWCRFATGRKTKVIHYNKRVYLKFCFDVDAFMGLVVVVAIHSFASCVCM